MTAHPGVRVRRRRWPLAGWIAAGIAVLAIGVGAAFGSRLGTDPTLVDSPLIGTSAPSATLPELEGDRFVSLEDLRGRIVVVNFWASWCVACREEHPALVAAANNYRDAGVTFVGVNYQDRRDAAVGFLNEMGRGDPAAYRYVTDTGSKLALEFGVFGIPETFFINTDGTIVAKITGASTYQLLSQVLDEMLAGRDPESRTVGTIQPGPDR